MSYDVYWVKNRAKKIADFERPTLMAFFLPILSLFWIFLTQVSDLDFKPFEHTL